MVYVKVGWDEEVAITHTRLNAMETQYDEFATDYNAHGHTDRYYTEAEADARFFSAATDGAGSGLDADTVDGYTTDEIEAAAIPRGNIGIWSGSVESIPSGWVLCDGTNDTPDLRDKFVVGAGNAYSKGETGGFASRTPTGTVSIADHTLVDAEMASHRHAMQDVYNNGSANAHSSTYNAIDSSKSTTTTASRTTGSAGGGQGHGHSGSTIVFDAYDNQPPYYALCWIMRELAS